MTLPVSYTGSPGKAGNSIKVLAIDTSSDMGSCALIDGDRLLGEYLFSAAQSHSVKLLSMIDRLLADTDCAMEVIDLVAVSSGPGSFTGLRVGISTAQGIALSREKVLIGVPTLEVIAGQACGHREQICPMIDARGRDVFTALYRLLRSDTLQRLRDEVVIEPERWLAGIQGETVFLGSGACRYQQQIKDLLGDAAVILPRIFGLPKASTVAHLAQQRYLQHKHNDLYTLSPMYIRPPDAERHAARRNWGLEPIISQDTAEADGAQKQ